MLSEFISISRELGFHQYCEEEAINNTFIEIAQESDGGLKLVNFSQFAVALGNLARKAGIDQFSPRKWRGKKTLLVEEVVGRTSVTAGTDMACEALPHVQREGDGKSVQVQDVEHALPASQLRQDAVLRHCRVQGSLLLP